MLFLFAGASAAQASTLAISGFFGSTAPFGGCSCLAGELGGPQGIAVNSSGTGAPAGTMYIAEQGLSNGGQNNRVSQYDPTGKFVRAWGADVVQSGPGQSNEVKRVTVNATGGSFKLTFKEATTADIPATAPAAAVQTQLNALPPISAGGGAVSVSGGPGDAGGTTPYLVSFDGGPLRGAAQPAMIAANGAAPLTGGAATVSVATINPGAVGFEICNPADGDVCKEGDTSNKEGEPTKGFAGALRSPMGVAVDQQTGNVYVANQVGGFTYFVESLRIEEFSASGTFIRAFGQDVVASGPDDSPPTSEVQTLTVAATGGKYSLDFGGDKTGEIAAGSGKAAAIQMALEGLGSIGSGNLTVTEPSAAAYKMTFSGALANNPEPLIGVESGPGEALTGGTATVQRTTPGATGFEVCAAADLCQEGDNGESGGALNASPFGSPPFRFPGRLAVAPSGAPNAGNVVLADPGNMRVQEFSPTGSFVRAFGHDVIAAGPDNSGTGFEVCEAAAGDACKSGTEGTAVGQFGFGSPTRVAVDSTGAIYTVEEGRRVQKFSPQAGLPPLSPSVFGGSETQSVRVSATAGQFRLSFRGESTADLAATATAGQVESALNSLSSITAGSGSVTVSGGPGDAAGATPYAVAFVGGQFAHSNPPPLGSAQGTTPLSGGTGPGANQVAVTTTTPGGPNRSEAEDGPVDIAIGPADHVFVAKVFPEGSTPVCPDGSSAPTEQHVQEMTPAGVTVEDNHGVCNEIKAQNGGTSIPISGMAVDPLSGLLYESRAPNGFYPKEEPNRVYIQAPGGPPSASLDSIGKISATGAVVSGTVNPNSTAIGIPKPLPTLFHLEYRKTGSPTWILYGGDAGAGAGLNPLPISVSLDGLEPNRSYEVRFVVTKQFHEGIAITPPQTFNTLPAAPRIEAFYASDLTASSATLHALINPLGEAATYEFEYGLTPGYGSSAPIPPGEIAAGTVAVPVSTQITGLNGGLYHFRIVATNGAGTATSGDQTFTFYPPSCPNEALRQQTGASSLPDCRGYELVSPGQAGNVGLFVEAPYAPEAASPTRFAFSGSIGGVKESGEPPSVASDVYVSTRTSAGWVTRYTGIPANEGTIHGGPPEAETAALVERQSLGSMTLDKILDWDFAQTGFVCCGKSGNNAPFLFDAAGNKLGRLPTNVDEVPGAKLDFSDGGWRGDSRPSPDFSHYVFSTKDLQFAPGGLTSAPGSVYDNEVSTGDITVVSRTAAGDIPPGTGGPDEVIRIPAVSTDGSHILMSTKAGVPNQFSPVHLYMSIDDGVAEDVSIGQDGLNHGVEYDGMTSDGGSVYFTSDDQLTADDHDESADLYVWHANDPETLTRLSQGSDGSGDSDGCSSSWTSKCDIQVLKTEVRTDNALAPESGDIYFYSPEQLVPGRGVPAQRNLYVSRGDELKQVTVMAPSSSIDRIQVVPDGSHMAVLTREKLTLYDNAGHLEMYTYEPDTGVIQCVSCLPDGSPPTVDVEASQNGIFLANDGRAFFTTGDPLVPEDINAKLRDVYEFVDNRPQLISSGSAPTDKDLGRPLGLVGITRSGIDVFFTTHDSLVGQDLNGPFLKFYDARTGGGFPFKPAPAPCRAADECHGPASSTPPPIVPGSTVRLGSGGNITKAKKNKHKNKNRKSNKKRNHSNKRDRKPKGAKS